MIRRRQAGRQTGRRRLLLGVVLAGCRRGSGGGRLQRSKELRQRRTTAGGAATWRSEVLMAGLGPADRRHRAEGDGSERQEAAEAGGESEETGDGSLSSSSLVSTTMSRQLPTLRGLFPSLLPPITAPEGSGRVDLDREPPRPSSGLPPPPPPQEEEARLSEDRPWSDEPPGIVSREQLRV